MKKRALTISISFSLLFALLSLDVCFMNDVQGMPKVGRVWIEERNPGKTPAHSVYLAQVANRVLRLTGASGHKVTLAPPCSVVGINGRLITLRDFYGQEATVEVEVAGGIRLGDKVVVKDGVLRIGISPR